MRDSVKLILESVTALLYVIIVATITLLYVDYDNIEFLKTSTRFSALSVGGARSGRRGLILRHRSRGQPESRAFARSRRRQSLCRMTFFTIG